MKIMTFQSFCVSWLLFLAGNVYASSVGQEALQAPSPVAAKDTVAVSDAISTPSSPANNKIEDEDKVYIVVEQHPEFPGGEAALEAYLRDNQKYPAHAAENGIQGRVAVSFIIEKDGSITNVKVFRSTTADELNQEAIRLINAMPRWKPGILKGKPVRVSYVLPVTFTLGQETPQTSSPVAAKDTVAVSDSISTPSSPANNKIDDEDFVTKPDQYPEFPGGEAAMMAYIRNNLKYPAHAAENGIQGRVTLSFIVEKDGSITNIEVMRSPADELSREAIRVVKSMPRWKPGIQKGKPVRVKYVVPFTFRLQEEVKAIGPEFPGGTDALNYYISRNLKYPKSAAKSGIQGRVTLWFIVETDGSISNIMVKRSPAEILSKEAIRMVKKMPRWKPCMQQGKPVRCEHELSITFALPMNPGPTHPRFRY